MPQTWEIPVATGKHMPCAREGMATPASLSLYGAECMYVHTYHHGPHLLVPGKDAGNSFLQCVLLSDANPSVLLAFLSLFIPPPLSSVKNETLSCSETVWGAAVLQFSDFCVFFPKLTLGNAYVHHFWNVTLSFSENSGFGLCFSFGRMHCSWPTNGGAVALRNGGGNFTAPNTDAGRGSGKAHICFKL